MNEPPDWFMGAMRDAMRKHPVLFCRGLDPDDRVLLLWALDQTKDLELSPEERAKCRLLIGQLSQGDP